MPKFVRRAHAALVATLAAMMPVAAQQRLGDEFLVNTVTFHFQDYPDVARGPNGDFIVVWRDFLSGNVDEIVGQRFDRLGRSLGGEFQVNAYPSQKTGPSIATSATGAFVVVWADYGIGGKRGIFGQRFDAAGVLSGAEFQVNTYTSGLLTSPAVATGDEGVSLVVWRASFQRDDIYGQLYDRAGDPIGGEFTVNTYTTNEQRSPAVSSTGEGGFVVTWTSAGQAGPGLNIFAQRFDTTGNPLGGEFLVNTYRTGLPSTPAVAADGNGAFIIVWKDLGASSFDVFAQRFAANGQALGSQFQVNTYTPSDQTLPDVSVDGEGNFVVVWESRDQDGDDKGVFAQVFLPDGTPRGGEFQVNTYTTDAQTTAAVASDRSGDFVVIWESFQDGSADGIYGQRFAGAGLHLEASGSCPGSAMLTVLNALPYSRVAIVAAANTNGFVKAGTICPGTRLEIGEPFALPPTFLVVDDEGSGSVTIELQEDRCFLQTLALADCSTSGVVRMSSTQN